MKKILTAFLLAAVAAGSLTGLESTSYAGSKGGVRLTASRKHKKVSMEYRARGKGRGKIARRRPTKPKPEPMPGSASSI